MGLRKMLRTLKRQWRKEIPHDAIFRNTDCWWNCLESIHDTGSKLNKVKTPNQKQLK
jgi:hypothetical protein